MTIADLRKLIENLPEEMEVEVGDHPYYEDSTDWSKYKIKSHSFITTGDFNGDKTTTSLVLWVN